MDMLNSVTLPLSSDHMPYRGMISKNSPGQMRVQTHLLFSMFSKQLKFSTYSAWSHLGQRT